MGEYLPWFFLFAYAVLFCWMLFVWDEGIEARLAFIAKIKEWINCQSTD